MEHPDLADRDVANAEGDYTDVRVSVPDPDLDCVEGVMYVKGLRVG